VLGLMPLILDTVNELTVPLTPVNVFAKSEPVETTAVLIELIAYKLLA